MAGICSGTSFEVSNLGSACVSTSQAGLFLPQTTCKPRFRSNSRDHCARRRGIVWQIVLLTNIEISTNDMMYLFSSWTHDKIIEGQILLGAIVVIFIIAYAAIALEHPIRINKGASALLGAGLLWTVYATLSRRSRAGRTATQRQRGHYRSDCIFPDRSHDYCRSDRCSRRF